MESESKQVCQDLLNLLKRLKASLADLAESHGLTPIQLHALYAMTEHNMTMSGLAASMHCDASNATGIVDRLVAHNLVTRQENEHDRRAKMLVLTPKGRQLIDAILAELPTQLCCKRLSRSEQTTLHEIVVKLA